MFIVKAILAFVISVSDTSFSITTPNNIPFKNAYFQNHLINLNSHILQQNKLQMTLTKPSMREMISNAMRNVLKNPYLVYAPDSSPRTNLGINIESSLGKIKSNGVELCSIEIAAHRSWDNSEVILGSIPYINPYTQPTPLKNWPLLEDTLITLKNQIVQKTFLPVESIISYKKCYFIDEGWLIPVFEIHITNDRKSFKVFADDSKIWSVEPLNLHSSRNAKALAYSSNPNNLEVEQDILVDASG